MRSSLLLAFIILAPLPILACGEGRSELADEDSGTPPPDPTSDAELDASCSGSIPTIACLDCNGNNIPIECVDGIWQCPMFGCPIQIDDASVNACSSAPPWACDVPEGCPENAYVPTCSYGEWTCTWTGVSCGVQRFAASPDDASPPPEDASPLPPGVLVR